MIRDVDSPAVTLSRPILAPRNPVAADPRPLAEYAETALTYDRDDFVKADIAAVAGAGLHGRVLPL